MKPCVGLVNRFRSNLAPRESLTVSQWAERHRVLSEHETSEPGPWRGDRVPYLAGIFDALIASGVEMVVTPKGAQIAYSEGCRNFIGYAVDVDPGPMLVVMPDQKSAEDYRDERLQPLLETSEAVRRHLSPKAWDSTKHRVKLDTMSVFLAWAGSSQGLKSRPIRYLILEEPDEYPPHSGTAGDPIAKALKRITTYSDKGQARVLVGGTPTLRNGNVWKIWETLTDRRFYWVPCPHCGTRQRLHWANVKWPKVEGLSRVQLANHIEASEAAHYECSAPHCRKAIKDHHKPAMLLAGNWGSEASHVPPAEFAKRVGFHISSLYSPWVPFWKLAVEWLLAQDDPQALCDFINQRLAEPAEEQRVKTSPTVISEKAKGAGPPLVVPKWARWLIATADTQGADEASGYFYWTVRAWGFGFRSALVDHGICSTKEELRHFCLDRVYDVEGGGTVSPAILVCDSGGPRWSEVYEMSQQDVRVKPSKGDPHRRAGMVEQRHIKPHNVILWLVDVEQAKDKLHTLIHDPDKSKWLPNRDVGDVYCRQLCAEAKVFDPKQGKEVWVEIVKNNNHFWDAEVLQVAAAWTIGAGAAEPDEVDEPATAAPSEGGNWAAVPSRY